MAANPADAGRHTGRIQRYTRNVHNSGRGMIRYMRKLQDGARQFCNIEFSHSQCLSPDDELPLAAGVHPCVGQLVSFNISRSNQGRLYASYITGRGDTSLRTKGQPIEEAGEDPQLDNTMIIEDEPVPAVPARLQQPALAAQAQPQQGNNADA